MNFMAMLIGGNRWSNGARKKHRRKEPMELSEQNYWFLTEYWCIVLGKKWIFNYMIKDLRIIKSCREHPMWPSRMYPICSDFGVQKGNSIDRSIDRKTGLIMHFSLYNFDVLRQIYFFNQMKLYVIVLHIFYGLVPVPREKEKTRKYE